VVTTGVAAFYQFLHLRQPDAVQRELQALCETLGLRGTVLVSPEGINGTLAGPPAAIEALRAALRMPTPARPALPDLEFKRSTALDAHFDRLKIKVKREIITFGRTLAADTPRGVPVAAGDWNAVVDDPDMRLVDTRNAFEVALGTFRGAIDPGLTSFSDFKDFVDEVLSADKQRPVAMFCTGGIRCEKASAYMLEQGFADVRQLQGGILRYLETIPADSNRFGGKCFVFDRRETLGHGLTLTTPNVHPNFLDTARLSEADYAYVQEGSNGIDLDQLNQLDNLDHRGCDASFHPANPDGI